METNIKLRQEVKEFLTTIRSAEDSYKYSSVIYQKAHNFTDG